MHAPLLTSDRDGTPSDPAIRACLRMLAQRGARLACSDAGGSVDAPRNGATVSIAWLDAALIPAICATGWLERAGDGTYRLSASGRAIVRLMKAGPSPAQAGAGTTEPPSSARPAPPTAPPVDRASPLSWLRARRHGDGRPYLSDEAFEAGERLRFDFDRAALMPRTTVDWDAVPRSRDELRGRANSAGEPQGGAAAARERVRRALASVPPELGGLLLDVCCFGLRLQDTEKAHGMPQRSAHYLLGIALSALARHYGLLPPADGAWRPRPGMRHWGASDYRPTIDGRPRPG